jgi:hypothetical protein
VIVLASLLAALRDAARFNKHELAAPRVILWPDERRAWASCIEPLRQSLPWLWSLGEYAPGEATGPAAWLRYQLDMHSGEETPVIYLPGIERAALRSADQCPSPAAHLFALQFQGQFWTQKNGKDWTPFAFLSAGEGGLGLEVASDEETRRAIQECLGALLRVEVDELRGRKLEAGDFRAIVTKDPARTLLKWMGAPDKMKTELEASGTEWLNFRAVCRADYGFDPVTEGALTAAERLTEGKRAWPQVWQRYKEAPRAYPGVKELLAMLPPKSLFDDGEFWPRWNQKAEERLEADLGTLSSASPKDACERIEVLAAEHQHRAGWVWVALDEAPLARAIVHLREVAEIGQASGNPSTWEALADYYRSTGWKADYAVLRALDAARAPTATRAVSAAIRAVYLPWLEKFSMLMQSLSATYPATGPRGCRALPVEQGTVYLFADGLRLDLARALEARLARADFDAELTSDWTALPTVTATAKPAFLPLAERLGGPLTGAGFQAKERANGKDLVQARFKQLLTELGMSDLEPTELGLPIGCAWTEYGCVDTYGHEQGAKLSWRVEEELDGLQRRITELLRAGWGKVRVVTDHGWLLVPGGLPKVELPQHLTASRWSRCAVPGPGAQHGCPMTAWFWDAAEAVVLAPGVSCFLAGKEYAHGGLTMQEALIPSLTVTARKASGARVVVLKNLKWAGMRLNVVLEGAAGLTVDLRGKVADAGTSFAANPVVASADGHKTSLLAPDDDREGTAAFLVVLDGTGECIFMHRVVIGEN